MGPVPAVGPAISHDGMLVLLVQIGVLLILATGLGALATRFNQPAVFGELVAGILVGPSVLGSAAPAVADRLFPPAPEQTHLLGSAPRSPAAIRRAGTRRPATWLRNRTSPRWCTPSPRR